MLCSLTAKAASILQSKLLDDRNQWKSAVMAWSRLQGELASTRTTAKAPSTALGLIRKRAVGTECVEQTEEGEKCLAESRKCTGEQRQQSSGNEKLKSDKQNGSWTLKKKRKRDDEEEDEKRKSAAVESNNDKNVEKGKTSKERKSEEHKEGAMDIGFMGCKKNEHETDVNGRGSVSDHSTTGLEHNVKTSSRMVDDTGKTFAVENVRYGNGMNHFLIHVHVYMYNIKFKHILCFSYTFNFIFLILFSFI